MPHTELPNTRHYDLKSISSKLLQDAWNGLKSPIFFGYSLRICLVFIILIILATNGFNYYAYLKCWLLSNSCHELKIISLNVWGMPKLLGGGDFKNNRMEAIGNLIAQGDYDILLLQELWLQDDHELLSRKIPDDYVMTGFRQLSLNSCDGIFSPWSCSGLAVVSRHNFTEVEFNSFGYHGYASKALIDGEILASKGVGRVRIMPAATIMPAASNITVDVFVTHTVADPDPSHGYDNFEYRVLQIDELLKSYISKSNADLIILGGDFNTEPDVEKGSPYQLILEHSMTNCMQEIYKNFDDKIFATYGNAKNTFTGGKEKPVIYDYIFHQANKNNVISWTKWFEILFLQTTVKVANEGISEISISDHQGIEATIKFWN